MHVIQITEQLKTPFLASPVKLFIRNFRMWSILQFIKNFKELNIRILNR